MAVQASLVYTAADGTKQDLILRIGEDTTIGRHPNCSLTISQPSVSRRHARLWFDQGVWFVEDLQSSNGTFVNNRRINRAQLTEGDELRCGDFVLIYGVEEKTRAVQKPERREQPAPPAQSPHVSNRATIGLDSPPPIPEAPRLAPARPPAPAPAPAVTPQSRQESPFDGGAVSSLQQELDEAKQAQAALQEELRAAERSAKDQEDALTESRDAAAESKASLQALRVERDAAARDLERLEEQRERQDQEINTLSTENRALSKQVDELRVSLSAAESQSVAAPSSEDTDALNEQIRQLRDQINAKDLSLTTLRKDLEDMHLRAPTQANVPTTEPVVSAASEEFTLALSTHSSELRVALKSI